MVLARSILLKVSVGENLGEHEEKLIEQTLPSRIYIYIYKFT